jgi:hypothetical protein
MTKPRGYRLITLPTNVCGNCEKCEITEQSSLLVSPPGYNYDCKLMPEGPGGYNGNTLQWSTCDEFEMRKRDE